MLRPATTVRWDGRLHLPAALAVLVLVVDALSRLLRGPALLDDLAQLVVAAAAVCACIARALRVAGRMALAWTVLAVGCAGWTLGQALWIALEVAHGVRPSFPSAADAGFLVFPVAAALAVTLFPAGRARVRSRDLLDGGVLALTLLTITWTVGLQPALRAQHGGPVSFAVSLAYPLLDVVVLTMALLAVGRARHHLRPLVALAAAMAAMAVSDTLFPDAPGGGLLSSGGWAGLGWVTGFTLVTLAATFPARPPMLRTGDLDRPSTSALLAAVPYGPLGLTVVAAGVQVVRDGRIDAAGGTLLIGAVCLTFVRQYLTVRDNRQLLAQVEKQRRALSHQAFHDPLTGLANRARFVEALEHALAARAESGRPVAVLFCDLDGFKGVNDGLGHGAGDRLLAEVADRLRTAVAGDGLVARLGGDEFAVLVGPDGRDAAATARAVAGRLSAAVEAPLRAAGRPVRVGVSIGVAGVGHGDSSPPADVLLSRADVAMYTAKRSGGRSPVTYVPGLALPEAQDWRILPAFEQALAAGRVEPYYQPVVDLATGAVRGHEALARWQHGVTRLGPEDFLPVATRNGLIRPLTMHMLATSLAQQALWLGQDSGLPRPRPPRPPRPGAVDAPGPRISVNVSPSDVVDPAFVALVEPLVRDADLPPGTLVVEVTEDALLTDGDAAARTVNALHDLGVLVALDDFGAGYSALAHLAELPFDVLKLDRRFVRDIDSSATSRTLLRGVISLAHDLGLLVVAEGVEREAQADVLLDVGCTLAQGFLFAPALPASAVDAGAFLRRSLTA